MSTSRPGGERVLRAQDELLAVFGEAGSLLVYLSFPDHVTARRVLHRAREHPSARSRSGPSA
ncbi:hypothetical protein AB0H97_13305 [Streptomyces sp. NPDC050788]|uniref:hypothetical protein n=1 Tax=Streptomyces sp. NPDC050788 TaxID=3155041 RepID=UPI00343ACB39